MAAGLMAGITEALVIVTPFEVRFVCNLAPVRSSACACAAAFKQPQFQAYLITHTQTALVVSATIKKTQQQL